MAIVERVLELYREQYFDLNLRHFHEKLRHQHAITLSYSWVKGIVQGARLASAEAQTWGASTAARATAITLHAAAHRWQPASLVSG